MITATSQTDPTASTRARIPPRLADDGDSPSASRAVGRNASWMFAANLVYAVCQWGMLSLLTRFGETSMVGKYILTTAIVAPVMALCLLNLRSLQASDARREFSFSVYLALRVLSLVVALTVISGVALWAQYGPATNAVLIGVALVAAVEALSDVFYGAIQQRERLDQVAKSTLLKSIAGLAVFAIVLIGWGHLTWALLAVALVRIVVFSVWDVPQTTRLLASPDKSRAETVQMETPSHGGREPPASVVTAILQPQSWTALAIQALPMGVVMMLISLSSMAPRYFVEFHLGEEALGVFGAVAYFMLIGKLAINAVGQTYTPQWSVAAAEGRRGEFFATFWRLSIFGAALGVAGVLVAWLAGPLALWLAYGPKYADQQSLLMWMMVATVAAYPASFTGFALTAARCFRIQVLLYGATTLVTAAACIALVPRYGLAGAAMSLLVAAVFQMILSVLVLAFVLPASAPTLNPAE